MSRLTVTNFTKRTGSPFQKGKQSPLATKIVHKEVIEKTTFEKQKEKQNKLVQKVNEENIVHEEVIEKTNLEKQKEKQNELVQNVNEEKIVHEEVIEKTTFEKQKERQNELVQKVNKKAAEYQSNKPSSGVFTEVVTHGAFTSKTSNAKNTGSTGSLKVESPTPPKSNGSNGSKSLLGFPSSANDLALDAKSDLESDANISKAVKDKVIEKLFALVSMVQHTYESKVRIMTEFEKYKDTHMKNEIRREKEYSEQLYKLNMNFQNEVVQAIQRLKSELDISRNVSKNVEESNSSASLKDTSIDFNTFDAQDSDLNEKSDNDFEESSDLNTERLQVENSDVIKDE